MAEKKTRGRGSGSKKAGKAVKPVEILPSGKDLKKKAAIKKGSTPSDRPVRYDPLSAFYNDIRHYPVLTREEEKALAIRYHEENDIDAAYSLVTSNLKLVVKIAMEYRRLWKEIIDLVQEGNVGLMQAVKKYDPYRGVRFSSYAAWWIRAYIIRYIMNNTRMVKLGTTQAQRTLYFQMGKERERLRKMGIEPDTKALAKSLQVKESEVEEMTQRLSGGDVSMEAARGDAESGFTMLDAIPSPEPGADEIVADVQARTIYLEKLSEFVAALSERDRKIFTSRWMRDDPYTLQEIGDKLGITRERVRQLEARIMKNLRAYLEKEGLSGSDFFS
ncbi:MAG: sigma-70 family RNA polymerase sigma factor [Deltaproteobacteria bacterium]|nr:sigma-70 family RNA polymerase sigma factor [Deltaproteobacteria bacterium]